jgi:pimeloyl-ACP methyl ester carboxylesterase
VTTFVLLHGAFHGAWCWARVVPLLRAAGHTVFTPTQTGLGDRAHLLHGGITLSTFADDLAAVLETEELTDAVLVGHSFGGIAISAAAERMPERVKHLIYLDSNLPQNGVCPLDLAVPAIAAARRRQAAETGGLSIPAPEPSVFGVPDGPDADWLRRRMTPHPFGSMATSLNLQHSLGNGRPATYVFCTQPVYEPLAWARAIARQQPGWAWREIAAGHDCMVTAPAATADLLMEIAP